MKVTINSCAEATLNCGTSAAIPLVLGFAMGCVIPFGVWFLQFIWLGNIAIRNEKFFARCSPLLGGVVFVIFIVSIILLVWLFYRFRIQNGKNIVALEKARYEVVKETLKFTTSRIAMSGGKIVIGDKIVFGQDNPEGGKGALTNQAVQKVEIAPSDANEITFSDSALSSTCG